MVPLAPASNDPSYAVAGLREWYLIGNVLTAGHDTIRALVACPPGHDSVHAFVDSACAARCAVDKDTVTMRIDIGHLPSGSHLLLLSADDADTAFAAFRIQRTQPLYVVVSNDWDWPSDTTGRFDRNMVRADSLHLEYPGLRITHLVGPHAFTDPAITESRQAWFVEQLTRYEREYDDEIGLHIHGFCHFVTRAGVDCRLEPAETVNSPDDYMTPCYAYPEDEFGKLLDAADSLFVANGLRKPTSFRAGGWWAELHTLRALASHGFVVDGSGCNYRYVFDGDTTNENLRANYEWFTSTWYTMNDTTQPYRPSATDVARPGTPSLNILEVPDNAALAYYVSAAEMVDIFRRNWDGRPLPSPRQFSIGYHPILLEGDIMDKLRTVLDTASTYLADEGNGPVVYARMSDLALVW
ncbi:MAG: hypothetical protein GF331_23280 [Chitinivibrionales bacterium]|nr:hypothetical protein [Chitinivibrionales bacterium]